MVMLKPTMFAPAAIWYNIEDLFDPEVHERAKWAFAKTQVGRNTLNMIKLISLLKNS